MEALEAQTGAVLSVLPLMERQRQRSGASGCSRGAREGRRGSYGVGAAEAIGYGTEWATMVPDMLKVMAARFMMVSMTSKLPARVRNC